MQIYAKNRYRFPRPNAPLLTGGGSTPQTLGKQVEFKDAFFELEPDKFNEVPDDIFSWVKEDQMFKWASETGDIKVIAKGTDTSLPPQTEEHTHHHQSEEPHPHPVHEPPQEEKKRR